MNETQGNETNISAFVVRRGYGHGIPAAQRMAGFMHPDDVLGDAWLTPAEKREILASWASDARAVADAPALRQLDNGAVIRIDDILRALTALGDTRDVGKPALVSRRDRRNPRLRLPKRLRSALRRSWKDDDDDDPPPCPAFVGSPLGGPLSGGEFAVSGLAVAA
jgi:hypothetical protein